LSLPPGCNAGKRSHTLKIRAFQTEDLAWLEPIARKHGEWEAVQRFLKQPKIFRLVGAWVIAPKAIVASYKDDHGYVGMGLCDKDGIKELFKLSRKMTELFNNNGVDLHTHVTKGTWQYKLFEKLGYVESWPDGVLKAYAIVKEVA